MFYLLMGRNLLKKIVKYSLCLVLEKLKYRQPNGAGHKKYLKNQNHLKFLKSFYSKLIYKWISDRSSVCFSPFH